MTSPPAILFTKDDKIIDLINEDFNILPILSRFSIPLGFGSKTIGQVCGEQNLSTELFLLIVNFIITKRIDMDTLSSASAVPLVDFLHNSHDYFTGYKFPHIRSNLLNALDTQHHGINPAIVKFFDDYVSSVTDHFEYEENTVFPYIRSLACGNQSAYNIATFSKHHEEISRNLTELKNIILRFYTTSMPNRMYDVLVDLFNCEDDLQSHHDIENHILVPLTARLEGESASRSLSK